MGDTVLTSMSLSLLHSLQLTAEERILIAVVSTVVVAITEVFRADADVGAVTLDLARRTRPVSCLRRAKIKTSTTGSKTQSQWRFCENGHMPLIQQHRITSGR